MARKRKKITLTRADTTAVNKTIDFDITRLQPVRVIRWIDKSGRQQEIYLYSDNYPHLPSERSESLSAQNCRILESKLDPSNYWYNHYPNLIHLVESISAVVRVYAILTKNSYSALKNLGYSCCPFFEWLLCQKEITAPASFSDITLEILLRFRDYLYHHHDNRRLSQGLTNDRLWSKSIPGLVKFFLERPSYNNVNPSISLSTFPMFYSGKGAYYSTVIPYSDLEAFEIITAADKACSDYMHNWEIMREIEQLQVGEWTTIEDICWAIINIERQSNNKRLTNGDSRQYIHLREKFGLGRQEFYEHYSEEEIQHMAAKGSCPYDQFNIATFESLSVTAQRTYARAWVRRQLRDLFDARSSSLLSRKKTNWTEIWNSLTVSILIIQKAYQGGKQKLWEAAGLKPLPTFSRSEFISLFFPTLDAIYAFHLFVMAISGTNLHVINSIDRNTILSDLDPDNVVYRGVKKRTGNYNYRHEEIVVPRKEPNGIHERLDFVKEITAPLIDRHPYPDSAKTVWLGFKTNGFRDRGIGVLDRDNYFRSNSRFCSIFGLQEVIYGENGELVDSTPMTYIDSRRLRKTNVFKDMAENVSLHEIQAALADGSFETVFKCYIDNNIQRQVNFKATAVLQYVLMQEINAYSRETAFAGNIIYDVALSDAKDISENLLSACSDRQHPCAGGETEDSQCHATFGRFDVCLGCKNARVFREHLPSICFRIIQYDQKKTEMSSPDWVACYGIYRHRAIDCLGKYAKHAEVYAQHVDAASVIAKSEGGVYLPPLL